MTLEQELSLSYYREVAEIDSSHGISLVQDVRSRQFFVKKRLKVYNWDVYRYLLSHPIANTPRICLAAEDGACLTLIEEYIPGDTLEELLEKNGPLPEEQVLRIGVQLCDILSAFHSCTPAIVNRDIKPANLKLSPDGVLKLLDLNAAKFIHTDVPEDTVLLGTQGYAAPEQYGFGPSSVLTDIYAAGVLLNVLRTGVLPNRRRAEGPLGEVIRRCVELSPDRRYQSAAQLKAALNALQGVTPEAPNWRRFLPPGYRSKNPLLWCLATICYALGISFCCSLQVENAGTGEVLLNRLFFALALAGIAAFTGNYLNIQSGFILTRSHRWWIRWLGILLVDLMILAASVILLITVVSLL